MYWCLVLWSCLQVSCTQLSWCCFSHAQIAVASSVCRSLLGEVIVMSCLFPVPQYCNDKTDHHHTTFTPTLLAGQDALLVKCPLLYHLYSDITDRPKHFPLVSLVSMADMAQGTVTQLIQSLRCLACFDTLWLAPFSTCMHNYCTPAIAHSCF